MKSPVMTVVGEGLILRPMALDELDTAQAMTLAADSRDYIVPGTMAQQQADYARPDSRLIPL